MLLEKLEQEGIKKELEALGYNCEELREKDYPWEEWFIQFDEPVHHVLFMHDQEICNAEVPIPEGDTQHPAEICGRTWYYYDDKNSYPHFAGKSEPR